MNNVCHVNTNQKKAGVSIVLFNEAGFRAYKRHHYKEKEGEENE